VAAWREIGDDRLVAAVVGRDAEAARACLEAGADPDTPGPDGLPLLCTAVAGFDHESADALSEGGADPGIELPDGTTPLLRAVDLGSPAVVEGIVGANPQMRLDANPRLALGEAARTRLLDLARHWYETGAEEELRRRTGATGPATRRLVRDGEFTDVDEVSLGGATVRDGYAAILTLLECAFGITAPVAELVARAVRYPDETHVNWSEPNFVLARRWGARTWAELAPLRHHPDPDHRRFLADVLWGRYFHACHCEDRKQDIAGDAAFVADWVLDEPDGPVLAAVLNVHLYQDISDEEAIGLRYAGHPDPLVRRQVPYYLTPSGAAGAAALLALAGDPDARVRSITAGVLGRPRALVPAAREALLTLIHDPELGVRAAAAESLALSEDRTAEVTESLAALLDEEDQSLRLEGAFALAVRDDPRTDAAYARVGLLSDPKFEHDHRVGEHWRYEKRRRAARSSERPSERPDTA